MARTLVDLAPEFPPNQLARAFHEAAVRHRTKPDHVEAVLARRPKGPGAKNLRRVIYGDEPVTLSALERAFLGVLLHLRRCLRGPDAHAQ